MRVSREWCLHLYKFFRKLAAVPKYSICETINTVVTTPRIPDLSTCYATTPPIHTMHEMNVQKQTAPNDLIESSISMRVYE